ncbi:2-oxoacid:acceptor oxidoreductase family protein [Paraburkholderia dinghuensis]|uniref:Pyruvate/ketoisovalerate oxidoreductase catalytic domain-containing protein n=1 Tax=Paraburkholderia dinghuensis TaxID=2305225 RepID=A0A3N6N2T2_9BURK|nr:2-oxoacid:acceptor oxidoreductase family protein [Paraburkholderia dinghuensis]RQH04881.1 hypothetical protein D1Y85_15785 [Paraburkholderia dinghuensis]
MTSPSVSFIDTGSGGAGAISTGTMLLEAAGRAGCYGCMTRSVGAQICSGEVAAMVRLGTTPQDTHASAFDLLVALDFKNLRRYAAKATQ